MRLPDHESEPAVLRVGWTLYDGDAGSAFVEFTYGRK